MAPPIQITFFARKSPVQFFSKNCSLLRVKGLCIPSKLLATASLSTTSKQNQKVCGFIGLGNMGGPMALNLAKKGNYKLVVYDISPNAVKECAAAGAEVVASPGEVAQRTDNIVTMLPSSPHVIEAYTNKSSGIIPNAKPGTLMIDCSTIDPSVSRQVAASAAENNGTFMDAPVSGGVPAAQNALLTFMVGGSRFDDAREILQHMGKNVVHCGEVGTGEAAKICNNMLLGISMLGVSETMNLGISLGLDPKLLTKILNMSSGRCWSTDTYNPVPGVMENVPASRDYDRGFNAALMLKDLGLAQAAASAQQCATPLGGLAFHFYRVLTDQGYGQKDFGVAFKYLSKKPKE